MLKKSLYQEIVDNATVATGCHFVHITHFDPSTNQVRLLHWSGMHSRSWQLGLAAVRRLFPAFDPTMVTMDADVNPFNRAVYYDGKALSGPVEEVSKGVVPDSILYLAKVVANVRHVFVSPLKVDHQVTGALAFHFGAQPTDAQERTCKAFAQQAALTLENARLVDTVRMQVRELQRSRELVTDAEERLRKEVAEMLHGRVQTTLLVAWHRLGQAESLFDTDPQQAKALLAQARQEIDQIREVDVRQASHLLHPSIIRVGLVPAVRSLTSDFRQHFHISIHTDDHFTRLDDAANNQIPDSIRLVAYRVLEEALNNIYRHATANTVEISLTVDPHGHLNISIRDDGRGFDVAHREHGLGLTCIAARVEQVGGSWQLASTIGDGTTLSCVLPLDENARTMNEGELSVSA